MVKMRLLLLTIEVWGVGNEKVSEVAVYGYTLIPPAASEPRSDFRSMILIRNHD
jgi:hypothetical protein